MSSTTARAVRVPDGQRWEFDPGSRADPVALLSTWEHQTLKRMLNAL
ncbi:DUF7693 family protein [Pseudomonas capeferrum]